MTSSSASPSRKTENAASELLALIGKLKRRLRDEVGNEGLSLTQLAVLSHLERYGPTTMSQLARTEKVRPQSMGATIAFLQSLNLVEGSPDPNDGRRTLLSLTPQAAEKVQAARAAREDWLAGTITRQFTDDEQDALARGIQLLKRLAES